MKLLIKTKLLHKWVMLTVSSERRSKSTVTNIMSPFLMTSLRPLLFFCVEVGKVGCGTLALRFLCSISLQSGDCY